MPLYRFELGSKLEPTQMSKLAEEITEWHARAFAIPVMAISCHFQDVSDDHTFAGGKPKKGNRLFIHQRTANQNVPMEQLEAHAQTVISLWRKAVFGDRELSLAEEQAHSNALHGIYMVNSIGLAYEYGVFLPMTGTYTEWVVKNETLIHELACKRIPEFQSLVLEIDAQGKYNLGLGP